MADDIISSLEIIEKLLFPETDFWHDITLNYQNNQILTKTIMQALSPFWSFW